MNIRAAVAVLSLLAIGVSMTTPTFNAAELDLPAAITDVPESSAIMRIGVVTAIVESTNITVKISGSDVLVTASYQFPQYEPVLGDRVMVLKQDAQWFVLGTQSGEINSGAMNPSFEDGTIGATPSDWSILAVSAVAGAITFTKETGGYPGGFLGQPVEGSFVGQVRFSSNGAGGISESNIRSDFIPALPDQAWTAAFYIAGGTMGNTTLTLQELFIEFYDSDSIFISATSIAQYGLGGIVIPRAYVRPAPGTGAYVAPPSTAQVRLRLNVRFTMGTPLAGTASQVFYDYVILRSL